MQDRFRYRFWNGKYIYFFDIFRSFYLMELIDEKNLPVMQCTGLKDKNGNLIYEGDILEGEISVETSVHSFKMVTVKGVVTIPQNMFVACCQDITGKYTLFPQIQWTKTEVIGNIYENKELLGVK